MKRKIEYHRSIIQNRCYFYPYRSILHRYVLVKTIYLGGREQLYFEYRCRHCGTIVYKPRNENINYQ